MPDSIHDFKVLVVDDEQVNLELIENYLVNTSYELTLIKSGKEAILRLVDKKEKYDLILLDRMMPEMDGIEVLKTIKEIVELKHIPVIMQTARANMNEVSEGIQAGAFYYLTKPFNSDMLCSIMLAASKDVAAIKANKIALEESRIPLGTITQCRLRVKNLDEVKPVSAFLSSLFPDPENAVFGISELIINAIEHGNLSIGYDVKTLLLNDGIWKNEINRRLNLSENIDKYVEISYAYSDTQISLNIRDCGKGFSWQNFLEVAPHRATDNHGRGIAISRMMSFDELSYNEHGNEVTCRVITEEKAVIA